jgi:hypothetical protein
VILHTLNLFCLSHRYATLINHAANGVVNSLGLTGQLTVAQCQLSVMKEDHLILHRPVADTISDIEI